MSMIGCFISIDEKTLDAVINEPKRLEALLYADAPASPKYFDVDKAWHAIHFLLTGSAWEGDAPWALAILGGTEIGEDNGYGPPRYLTPVQVREVADALATVGADRFRERFDPAVLRKAEIYPDIWDRNDDLEYVLAYYEQLVSFYREAANRGDAMILYIS